MKNRRKQMVAQALTRLSGDVNKLREQLAALEAEAKADVEAIAKSQASLPSQHEQQKQD